MRTSYFRFSIALCLAVCALAPAIAQEDTRREELPEISRTPAIPAPATSAFGEVVEVNVVNVLATVTDRQGQPVYGLTRDDFEIFEDGKPVDITNFYAVRQDQVVESVTAQIERRGQTGLPAPVPEIEPSETRFLAIFVDNGHIARRNRKEVFQGLRDFVRDNVTSYDQIMVATLHEDYEVVQEFTGSPADVVIAIDRLERRAAEGLRTENSRMQLLRNLENTDLAPAVARGPGGAGVPAGMTQRAKLESSSRNLLVQIEFLARDGVLRAQKTIAALRYLMSSMAGLPGRKAVVYLSDGIPMRPGETLFHAHYNLFSNAYEVLEFDDLLTSPEITATKYDMTREFEALAAHAQSHQIMFSAIDAAGKHTTTNISAQRRMRDLDSLAWTEFQPAWNTRLDTLRVKNLQGPIELMAEETGGSVLLNTRQYGAFFGDLRDRLDNYYSLGYAAPHPKQGQQHKIEVRLKNPGLKVHHRRAYRDKTWTDRLTDRTVSELLLGVGSNPLGLEVTPGAATPKEDKKLLLPVQIVVPIGNLQLTPAGPDRIGSATIVLVIKDETGNTSSPYTLPLAIRLPEEEYAGATGRLAEAVVNLIVTPGRQVIGVGVRDDVGGVMSTKTLDLEITEAAG